MKVAFEVEVVIHNYEKVLMDLSNVAYVLILDYSNSSVRFVLEDFKVDPKIIEPGKEALVKLVIHGPEVLGAIFNKTSSIKRYGAKNRL